MDSAASEKMQCVLLCEVCLATFLHTVGAALRNDLAPECFLFVF